MTTVEQRKYFFSSSRHSGLKYTTTKQFPSVQIFASRAAISLKFDQKIPFFIFLSCQKNACI